MKPTPHAVGHVSLKGVQDLMQRKIIEIFSNTILA